MTIAKPENFQIRKRRKGIQNKKSIELGVNPLKLALAINTKKQNQEIIGKIHDGYNEFLDVVKFEHDSVNCAKGELDLYKANIDKMANKKKSRFIMDCIQNDLVDSSKTGKKYIFGA